MQTVLTTDGGTDYPKHYYYSPGDLDAFALVDYGEHKVSIEGIVARIHRSIAPDYERVLSPSDDNDDIFLAECKIVGISRIR